VYSVALRLLVSDMHPPEHAWRLECRVDRATGSMCGKTYTWFSVCGTEKVA